MRYTEKRKGKNVIPLRNSVCGVDLPHWSIHEESDIQRFLSGDAVDRLAELEDKIENGTLIELGKMPFKIGDTAYWLNGLPNCIQEYKVRGYSVGRMGLRIDLGDLEPLLYKVFGEILFCSREEAEKKLKELQNGF
jgi:hypothetical protein